MYYIVILYTSSYIAVLLCVYMQVKPVMVIAKNPRSDIQFYDTNQPVSSLRGMVVITSRSLSTSVKMHWYTPASERLKLEIRRSLRIRWPPAIVFLVMTILLPSATTCSPFLTHTTEGGANEAIFTCPPVHLNTRVHELALTWSTVLPRRMAVRLSLGPKSS